MVTDRDTLITEALLWADDDIVPAEVQALLRELVEAVETMNAELAEATPVEWEYGTRWHVPGDPRASWEPLRHDRVVDYVEDSQEVAERILRNDRIARPNGDPGILIRRPVFDSPWEEVE